jgi:hypothetical protein
VENLLVKLPGTQPDYLSRIFVHQLPPRALTVPFQLTASSRCRKKAAFEIIGRMPKKEKPAGIK